MNCRVTIGFLLLLLSCIFCSQKIENTRSEIIITYNTDPISSDPIKVTDINSQKLLDLIYTRLFRFNEKGKIINELVQEFQWKDDYLEIILKKHICPNGEILTSQEVYSSLNRLRSEIGPKKNFYSTIQKIQIISNNSLRIYYSGGKKNLLQILAFPQASIYIFKNNKILESGIYAISYWKKNNFIFLSQKKNSHSQFPRELTIKIIPEPSTKQFLFFKKQIDSFEISNTLFGNKDLFPKENLISKKGKSIHYIAFNHKNVCFDKFFRESVNYSINKELIIQKIYNNFAHSTIGPIPDFYVTDKTLKPIQFNISLGKKLLKQSVCYPKILNQNLELRFRGDSENKAISEIIESELINLGLNVRLKLMEKKIFYKENSEGKGDLTFLKWISDYPDPWNFIDPLLATDRMGGEGNRSFYRNPEIFQMIQKHRITNNLDSHTELNKILHEIIENYPWVFLWSIDEMYLISEKLKNFPAIQDYL